MRENSIHFTFDFDVYDVVAKLAELYQILQTKKDAGSGLKMGVFMLAIMITVGTGENLQLLR